MAVHIKQLKVRIILKGGKKPKTAASPAPAKPEMTFNVAPSIAPPDAATIPGHEPGEDIDNNLNLTVDAKDVADRVYDLMKTEAMINRMRGE
ncbi:MAG TPA: hypothetical protein PKA27_11955 [Fimbriimonadaceae bacterium]|nr:hypothetical protein [Fimbriimonadaceae bacterium]